MIKKMMIVLAAFSLSGCFGMGTHVNTPTQTEYKVVMPEDKYFTCDMVQLPDPSTLTDTQIAQLINDLYSHLKICHNNMGGIKTYLQAAQNVLEQRKN